LVLHKEATPIEFKQEGASVFVTSDDYLSQVSRVIAEGDEVSIAVAFLGEGAERLFAGIAKPVRLLCNLMSGATNPEVIERLRGNPMVHVRRLDDLHAKVIHTPTQALIGSANLSANGLNLEGREGAGWREAGYLVRETEPLAAIHRWFEQQWNDRGTCDISDADIEVARQRWELRRGGRLPAISRTARLVDVPIEQLKGLPIYLVLYNKEASVMASQVADPTISTASEKTEDSPLAGKMSFFEDWPELPKDAALLSFKYGSRLGLKDGGAWKRIPELDTSYQFEGENVTVQIVVAQEGIRDWSYDQNAVGELANALKPVMKQIVELAGDDGDIVIPLHQALAIARGHE